jgi:hypothetical protein
MRIGLILSACLLFCKSTNQRHAKKPLECIGLNRFSGVFHTYGNPINRRTAMNTPIIVALIAGSFAIISPIVTFIAIRFYEKRFLQPISRDRKQALVGKWSGKIIQPNISSDIALTIEVDQNEITGKAQVTLVAEGKEKLIFLDMKGGFLYDRFLKLDYKNADSNTIQFGSITLELDAEPKSMNGKFSGYGSVNKAIVFGDIQLEKQWP